MSSYLHGAYGQIQAVGNRVAASSEGVIVYVGTAPVHNTFGAAERVNRPVLVHNIQEARNLFGYSEDWASYTLCEAMHVHLEQKGVGPIVLINVLDPAVHKKGTSGTSTVTPSGGRAVISGAGDIVLDTIAVTGKTKGEDYTVGYDPEKEIVTLYETSSGSLGTNALTVTYDIVDASLVTAANVIGTTDGQGLNTGLYAVRSVYPVTGRVPAYLAVPGFSSVKTVHDAMAEISVKINAHWDAYMFVDLPLANGQTPLTLATVAAYKASNGYDKPNETVYFPMAAGTDGKKYHISVLAAANFQELLLSQEGVPYRTASNTACPVIQNLYMGEDNVNRVYDDEIINEFLNKNGIASAAFVGGRWAIWGAHSADYTAEDGDYINVAETNRMMLFYISNDFQRRRTFDVDKPMTANDLQSIVKEEQGRLDALKKIGALTYGVVLLDASSVNGSDVMNGDFTFAFEVTTTPLAKSLKAIVNWTDDGFITYFEGLTA